ncbi:thiamine phosphate synthase [Sphingobacterium suaedae]|uniref:Thiamine-phosphate synthase n=1 Tax=Sphingobacterium suaedae TaxID=1686402 RepID=A0ABW5KI32_9SPHI
MKNYSNLQYISSGDTPEAHFDHIMQALQRGVNWVQLRIKNAPFSVTHDLALRVLELKQQYNFTFIINDSPILAKSVHADGVHLGLNDMPVTEARHLLGPNKIIGGTANTLSDVLKRTEEQCDYIGLGPFRHTETKNKLSPILGLGGYAHIIQQIKHIQHPPIFAIGGICAEDLPALRHIGIYGAAISKHIQMHFENEGHIETLKKLLHEN